MDTTKKRRAWCHIILHMFTKQETSKHEPGAAASKQIFCVIKILHIETEQLKAGSVLMNPASRKSSLQLCVCVWMISWSYLMWGSFCLQFGLQVNLPVDGLSVQKCVK